MNTKPESTTESLARPDPRELKTLTLRIPFDLHEQIERSAKEAGQSLNQFIADAARAAAQVSTQGADRTQPSLAVVVDLDSFAGRAPINIEALERVAVTLGRPVLKLSFATSFTRDLTPSRHAALSRHFRHEELRSRDALRMRMAADALDAFGKDEIRDFVIVSADEELAFVANLIRSRGGHAYGIGVRSHGETSVEFIRAFDGFQYYDKIASPPESDELRRVRIDYAKTLVQVAFNLESRAAKPVGSAIIPLLRDRRPEVSLELLEIRSWRELAEIAREQGLVVGIEPSGVDFLVRLSDAGRIEAKKQQESADVRNAELGEIASIRAAITEIIGTELPDVSARFLIFNAVQWILGEEARDGVISLVQLSYRVVDRLGSGGIQQNTVYRLLNGLYRCGAFEVQANSSNDYDPQIIRARIPVLSFDDAFVLNLMRIRKKFPIQSSPDSLSSVLYGSNASRDKVAAMLRIAADPQFGRSNLTDALSHLDAHRPG